MTATDMLRDLKVSLRDVVALPQRVARIDDLGELLQFIASAELTYQERITEHLECAWRVLPALPADTRLAP